MAKSKNKRRDEIARKLHRDSYKNICWMRQDDIDAMIEEERVAGKEIY